jgi:hypothetical protein
MITLSLNFHKLLGQSERTTHEKNVRAIVDNHLTFPGSDKLKLGVTIKENGASTVSFAGPGDVVSEAKRIWSENVTPAANKIKAATVKSVKTIQRRAKKALAKAKPKAKTVASAKTKATMVKKSAKKAVKVKVTAKKKPVAKKKK